MSTIAFLNIGMHGHINPTLPVVAELVRRGHTVTYHTSPAFRAEIEATGATGYLYPGGEQPLPDPPTPVTLLESLASTTVRLLPTVLDDLRRDPPDLIVHDSSCLWGAVAARELGVPAASSFTTFAFDRHVPSPTRGSWDLLAAARRQPRSVQGYLRARRELHRRFDARGLPLIDLVNIRQPLNLVYTSRAFQPAVEHFDASYRFVGPSIGARPADPSFPTDRLRDPVLYASLGTVFNADPQLLRTFATALAPLGGTVIVSTGQTDPDALGPLPANVLRPPLRASAGGAGPRGAVRHPRRDEQRQRGDVRRGPDAGGPAGRRPADGRRSRRRTRRRPVDPHPGRREGLRARPRPASAATSPGSGRPRPPCRPPSTTPGGYRRAADELERYLLATGWVRQSAVAVDPSQRG